MLPRSLEHLLQLLSNVPDTKIPAQQIRYTVNNRLEIVAERLTLHDRLNINSRLSPLLLNTSRTSLILPINFDNFGDKSHLMVSIMTLPSHLLANALPSSVRAYRKDAAEPDGPMEQSELQFQVLDDSIIRIGIQTDPETFQLPSPFTLLFQSIAISEQNLLRCLKWDPGVDSRLGGWTSGDCWYLGRPNDVHVCQCSSAGVYALFRPVQHENHLPSALAAFLMTFLSIAALCCLIGSIIMVRSRSDGAVKQSYNPTISAQDFQLKPVSASSIKYLSDR